MEEDDWIHEELPEVFTMIGPPALPALAVYEEVAHKQTKDWKESLLPSSSAEGAFTPVSSQAAYKEKAAQKKPKSKMAKLSRKKNRKR